MYSVVKCPYIFIFILSPLMFSRFLILFIYIINIRQQQVLVITQEQLGKSYSATSTFKCWGLTAAVLAIFVILCSHYVADLTSNWKKLELHLMVVSVIIKTEFAHTQISVSKIGIPMSKTACIKPQSDIYSEKSFSYSLISKELSENVSSVSHDIWNTFSVVCSNCLKVRILF